MNDKQKTKTMIIQQEKNKKWTFKVFENTEFQHEVTGFETKEKAEEAAKKEIELAKHCINYFN